MSKPTASQLPRLPRLATGSSYWYLPLNDYAAYELARLLVQDKPGERETLAAQLMSVDPSLTLWTVCAWAARNSTAGEGTHPRCVMDLAQWLAHRAGHVLEWSVDELRDSATRPDHRTRWRELAADAVAVANLAADPIADDLVAAESFLLGLVHNASDWLRSCGPRISLPKQQLGCLPGWLAVRLRERSRAQRSEPMQHVVQAARRWRASGRRTRQVDGVDVTDALWARRRWQVAGPSSDPGCHLLVALTEKLRELECLQHDFQRTLEQEKLASLGELAYGASHEINNPLANISTRAQALLTDEPDPERQRMLAIINGQAFRANEMIADMMLFARPPELACEDLDLVPLVDSLVNELAPEALLQGTQLSRTGAIDPLWVSADATQFAMALRAVIVNAFQALGADGEVDVHLELVAPPVDDGSQWARIAVRDTGPGIPPHVRRHLFDPFFSGREAGRGLGLGLAKCWRVMTLHAGRVDVSSAAHQGTTVSLSLPIPVRNEKESGVKGSVGEEKKDV